MKYQTLKEKYTKLLADHITVSVEDLTKNELDLINQSFILFQDKLEEIKTNDDEVKRLSIELANYKAMYGNINDDENNNHHYDFNEDL
jgi:ABC-type uncharacterized transport system ATPase subunit